MKIYQGKDVEKNIPQMWSVSFNRSAEKQYKKLKRSGSRPDITDVINLLMIEMVQEGPHRNNWPNYGPLEEYKFHCHLRKGQPTYVACWELLDKEKKIIEVYYVGTHENAPY